MSWVFRSFDVLDLGVSNCASLLLLIHILMNTDGLGVFHLFDRDTSKETLKGIECILFCPLCWDCSVSVIVSGGIFS